MSVTGITGRPWTFAGLYDATALDTEPLQMRKLSHLSDCPREVAEIVLQVRRQPHSRKDLLAAGLQCAAGPGVFAAGTAFISALTGAAMASNGAIMAGVATMLAGAGASLALVPFTLPGTDLVRTARCMPLIHQEPRWSGTRTVDFTAPTGPATAPAHIRGAVLEQAASSARPAPSKLAENLASTFRAYPSEYRAVILGGHGHAFHGLGGMTLGEMVKTLANLKERTGQRVDLLILDGCMMANLETMHALRPYARYVVASEEVVTCAPRPLDSALRLAPSLDPKTLGETLVRLQGGTRDVPTLSLIDTDRVDGLADAWERLAQTLSAASRDGHRREIRRALREALRFPRAVRLYKRGADNLGDAGAVLTLLRKHCTDAAVLRMVDETQAHLEQAVPARRNRYTHEALGSGLTIGLTSQGFSSRRYTAITGMPHWGQLMADIRPWHVRVWR